MRKDILVLGAGMIGTCTALELALRGHRVTLVDRRNPGRETSYGNAGVIQREAVEPYPFPRDWRTVLTAIFLRRLDIRYHPSAVWAAWPALLRYWWNSAPERHGAISCQYAELIQHSVVEHQRYIALCSAGELVRPTGFRYIYRTQEALQKAFADAERLSARYGIAHRAMNGSQLAAEEPDLKLRLEGAVHWTDSWSVSDPGLLVEHYATQLVELGGRVSKGDANRLVQTGTGWQLSTADGSVQAQETVLALGPWAGDVISRLGYRIPLFVKRGYHRHFRGGGSLAMPTLDAERGYVLAPQQRGLRLTTGAELATLDARHTPFQLSRAAVEAGQLLNLGCEVESTPWVGGRPCSADMKPVIGPAARHRGLWFNFGHGHQGFTLGPASARLLADQIEGRRPYIDAEPFLPARFG